MNSYINGYEIIVEYLMIKAAIVNQRSKDDKPPTKKIRLM